MKFFTFLATGYAFFTFTQATFIPIKRGNYSIDVLHKIGVEKGKTIKSGTNLRILGVGDSITVGFPGKAGGADGNSYRKQLAADLEGGNQFEFSGKVTANGTISDNNFAAWSGETIQYIIEHITPSLDPAPNLVLVHAGTNDMNPDPAMSREGHDPAGASERLGRLIDTITATVPEAVVLVAIIIPTCNADQAPQTTTFQQLVPGVVAKRQAAGNKVLAVDFSSFPEDMLRDCIHPTNDGYSLFGDYWYDFIAQIPTEWINQSIGKSPMRWKRFA